MNTMICGYLLDIVAGSGISLVLTESVISIQNFQALNDGNC